MGVHDGRVGVNVLCITTVIMLLLLLLLLFDYSTRLTLIVIIIIVVVAVVHILVKSVWRLLLLLEGMLEGGDG